MTTADLLGELTAEAEAYAATQAFERRPHDGPAIMWGVKLAKEGHSLQIGTYQVSDLCCHVKWLSQWPVTTSEIAAAYLRRVKEGHDMPLSYAPVNTQSALYFRRPLRFHPDLAYVDISGCYPNLFFPAGLDLHYDGHGHGTVGEVPFKDWPLIMPDKGLRNLLWGNLLSRHNTRAANGQLKVVYVATTANYRPPLCQYVFDSTHALAKWAIERFDVRCWLTDAAVVPGDQADDLIAALADEWLLQARVKWRGPGTLFALNHRRIGEHRTRVLARHPEEVRIGQPIDRIRNVPVEALMTLRRQLVEGELPMRQSLARSTPITGGRAICGACKQEHPANQTRAHRASCEVLAGARAEHPRRTRPKGARLLIGGAPGHAIHHAEHLRTCAACKAKFRADDPPKRVLPRPEGGQRLLIVCPTCAKDEPYPRPEQLRTCATCKAKFRADYPPRRPMPKKDGGWRERIVCTACATDWQSPAPAHPLRKTPRPRHKELSWPICRACRQRMGPAVPMVKCPSKTSGVGGPAHMCQDCYTAAQTFDLSPLPQLHVAPAGIKAELQLKRLAPAAAKNGLVLHAYRRLEGQVWWWLTEEVPEEVPGAEVPDDAA